MGTLLKTTKEMVERRSQALKEGKAALSLVKLLPTELQELNGEVDTGYYGEDLRVSISQYLNKDINLLRVAKMLGVQGLHPSIARPDYWLANGIFILSNDMTVGVYLSGLPNPPNCRIEEYTEEVTKYRAICSDNGS